MARITKYTPERIEKIISAISKGKTYKDASKLAGINPDTFFDWLKNKPEFSDAVKMAEKQYGEWYNEHIVKDAKASLMELICGFEQVTTKTKTYTSKGVKCTEVVEERKQIPPSATAIIFALCNRDPEHWQNRVSQDVNGKIDVEQKGNGVSLANVPDSLLAQVIDAINSK